jgi:hypothetical protein
VVRHLREVKYYITIFLFWSIPLILYYWIGFDEVHPNHADSKWIVSVLDLVVPIFVGLTQVIWTYFSRKRCHSFKDYPQNWGHARRVTHFILIGRLHYEFP